MIKLNMHLKILNTSTSYLINMYLSNFFYCKMMNYNYKLDENIFKMLIQRNILPTDSNKQ